MPGNPDPGGRGCDGTLLFGRGPGPGQDERARYSNVPPCAGAAAWSTLLIPGLSLSFSFSLFPCQLSRRNGQEASFLLLSFTRMGTPYLPQAYLGRVRSEEEGGGLILQYIIATQYLTNGILLDSFSLCSVRDCPPCLTLFPLSSPSSLFTTVPDLTWTQGANHHCIPLPTVLHWGSSFYTKKKRATEMHPSESRRTALESTTSTVSVFVPCWDPRAARTCISIIY